jgi:hypothetical protein
MSKKFVPLILIIFVCNITSAAQRAEKNLLPDGFVLSGVDGRLTGENGDRWFFAADSDLKYSDGMVKAGTKLEFLQSVALEKLVADTKERSALDLSAAASAKADYRVWGRVTRYGDKNFIFLIYFLPVAKIKQTGQRPDGTENKLVINEPNDAFSVPEDIVAKLEDRKVVRFEQLGKAMELKEDSILADRTGLITNQSGRFIFVFDGIGRNVQLAEKGIQLLACESLERANRQQALSLEPVRFGVAGILTKYKDQYYLLLQRVAPVYSNGNFDR